MSSTFWAIIALFSIAASLFSIAWDISKIKNLFLSHENELKELAKELKRIADTLSEN